MTVLTANSIATSTTTPVMSQIETLVEDVPGWSPLDQLYTLFQLAYETADLPGDIVELGSWCGRSALVLGLAARLSGRGQVHCVDLFPEKADWTEDSDGSYSFSVTIDGQPYGGNQSQPVWREPFENDIMPLYERRESLLDLFSENVARNQLQDIVSAFRGSSGVFARSASSDFRCRLVFIDGDHSYEAVCQDIENLSRFLVPGGWICFDDAFSSWEGVNRAITNCILDNPLFELGQQMTRKFFVARKKS